jgi:ubiquinone biosynthesis monooxygenase Coq7
MDRQQRSALDQILTTVGNTLAACFNHDKPALYERPNPAQHTAETMLNDTEKKHAAGLMRINHCGEVCAQALYQGQALTARDEGIRHSLQHAAMEEKDHLAWCAIRLWELDSHPSYLNLLWYLSSLGLGIGAGLLGDAWSLGFLAETEKQVCAHLEGHLKKLPQQDQKSQAIVAQMKVEEAEHQHLANSQGAKPLPNGVIQGMRLMAKLMTTLSYRI